MIRLPITINAAKIGETSAHKAFTFDLSRITDAVWWAAITAVGDIVVKDSAGNIKPRVIDSLDTVAKTGVITWDAEVSTAEDKVYYLDIISGYGAVNSPVAFTNDGCLIRYSMDNAEAPFVDSCGNYSLTNSGAILAQSGKIGKSVFIPNKSAFLYQTYITQLSSATKWTVSLLFKPSDTISYQLLVGEVSQGIMRIEFLNDIFYVEPVGLTGSMALDNMANYIPVDEWAEVTFVFDGSLSVNSRSALYVNGAPMELRVNTGANPSGFPISGAEYLIGQSGISFQGNIDELRHFDEAKSAGWAITEYNMIFDAEAVTIGGVITSSNRRRPFGFGFGFRL